MVSDTKQIEAALSIAVLRLLKWFNYLELNLGLSLSSLINEAAPKETYGAISNMSLEKKLGKFIKLVEADERLNTERIDLQEWVDRTNRARYVRNSFVHGSWEILPLRSNEPIKLRLPPWIAEDKSEYGRRGLTIQDVEQAADEMGQVFGQFMHIRKRLGV